MTDRQKQMIAFLGLSEDDFAPNEQTDNERIKELEEQNEMLTECILEMASIIYA